jgi:cardiolipin synthase
MLSVDGKVAFVTGLCVGKRWVGRPEKGVEPWRDTGVEITGPAVADLEHAFATMWSLLGPPIPESDMVQEEAICKAGEVGLRIVASYPNMAGLYRFDQLIAALAQRSIWIADAYFIATTPYLQALRGAAQDGVDVRLLLPQSSDVPIVRSLSRTGYRTLLEAGVRIFEWNGPMMHAKTAVADGRWARVGSTNLNLSSWLGNWELDVVVEDKLFAQKMEKMYLEDLDRSTEIVLSARKIQVMHPRPRRPQAARLRTDRARRTVTNLIRVGNTVGAAITSRRALGPAEAAVMVTVAAVLLLLVVIALLWPAVLVVPTALFATWVAISLVIRAYRLHATNRPSRSSNEVPRNSLANDNPELQKCPRSDIQHP